MNDGHGSPDSAVELDEPVGPVQRFVLFTVAGERLGLPLASVRELSRVPEVTPVPGLPPVVRGVVNLRGAVVAVVSIADAFGLTRPDASVVASEPIPPTGGSPPHARVRRQRMMVVEDGPTTAALVVDSIEGVLDSYDPLDPPVGTISTRMREFVVGHLHAGDGQLVTIVSERVVGGLAASLTSQAAVA